VIAHRHDHSVDLKRRPPKSLHGRSARCSFPIAKAARKDSAVHVSLSSDSLVKQPETPKDPAFRCPRRGRQGIGSRRSSHIRQGQSSWPDVHRVNSEGLHGTSSRHAAARQGGLYRPGPQALSTVSQRKIAMQRGNFCLASDAGRQRARVVKARDCVARAALRPHSSAVLTPRVGLSQTGVATASSELSILDVPLGFGRVDGPGSARSLPSLDSALV